MSADTAMPRSNAAITLEVVSVVLFTFLAYLTIGIPLAVLPGYVHGDLGFGSVLAGLGRCRSRRSPWRCAASRRGRCPS